MCCCHGGHFHGRSMWGHGCCCMCDEPGFRRRFFSKAEIIKQLEEYLEELKLEVKGLEERIEDLKKEI